MTQSSACLARVATKRFQMRGIAFSGPKWVRVLCEPPHELMVQYQVDKMETKADKFGDERHSYDADAGFTGRGNVSIVRYGFLVFSDRWYRFLFKKTIGSIWFS